MHKIHRLLQKILGNECLPAMNAANHPSLAYMSRAVYKLSRTHLKTLVHLYNMCNHHQAKPYGHMERASIHNHSAGEMYKTKM